MVHLDQDVMFLGDDRLLAVNKHQPCVHELPSVHICAMNLHTLLHTAFEGLRAHLYVIDGLRDDAVHTIILSLREVH